MFCLKGIFWGWGVEWKGAAMTTENPKPSFLVCRHPTRPNIVFGYQIVETTLFVPKGGSAADLRKPTPASVVRPVEEPISLPPALIWLPVALLSGTSYYRCPELFCRMILRWGHRYVSGLGLVELLYCFSCSKSYQPTRQEDLKRVMASISKVR